MTQVNYIPHPTTGKSTGFYEMHIPGEHQPRLFFQMDHGTGAGLTKRITYEAYRKPSGDLFHLPMNDAEGENGRPASSVCRIASNGSSGVNIYLAKPGWRFARAQDLIDSLNRAEANQQKEAQDRRDNNPARVAERGAQVQAQALVLALKAFGFKQGASVDEALAELSALASLPPPPSGATPVAAMVGNSGKPAPSAPGVGPSAAAVK